ncbi:MAG TPA: MBG domain-containing protein [Chitinophagaceae bacterium]|nr:MBG domain-containing protein [Chitinophagaceae bacterium]
MKKILFAVTLLFSAGIMFGQTTYYWVGGTGPTSYTANSNWNTQLNGGGTARSAAAANDILIFDGTNVGGIVPTTGLVTTTATSTNSGRLIFQNGAMVILGRASAGSAAITINGDGTAADDLLVNAGCTLTLGMAIYNYDVSIIVSATATALINGTVYLSPLSNSVHTRSLITALAVNSVVFGTGSACHITDSIATSGFNGSVQDGIVFRTGASLYYYTGRSPIGSSSTVQFTNFDPGSNLYFMRTNLSYLDGITAYSSSSWFNRKNLGNVFFQNGATIISDGPLDRADDFTIDNGCSFRTHTSGVTPILGNLTVNGTLDGPTGSTNIVVMGGNSPQTISGTGTIDLPSLTVANYSNVTLARSVNVLTGTDIFGKINFGTTNQLTGPTSFTSKVNGIATSITGSTVAGSYRISNVVGTLTGNTGLAVSGNGLAVNSNVTGFSSGNAVVLLSKPATSTVTNATFTFFSDTATMVTANANGMDSLTGSVVVIGNKNYQAGTNYIINGATTKPFGISSGSSNSMIDAGFVEINANVTVNRGINIYNHLLINGKLTLRPLDLVHIFPNAVITGTFSNTKYIAADYNAGGQQSMIRVDAISSATTIPLGTTVHYLPATITPVSVSDFTVAAFTGITSNGMITGTPLTAVQKQQVVDAVWNINRVNGTGNATLQINWPTALEGSTFTTLPNTDIGMIKNNGSSWDLPIGTGNNTTNIVTATFSSFGSFGAGAVPQTNPFIFNPLPIKTYGNPDFNGGATSLNTTQPIIYTSSNPAVATIVSGNIHITGAGTSVINASQASDGFYPPASVNQTLTVNKAPLTIKADDKSKFELTANPPLTITYTGFVLGETASVLLTQPTISTTAVLASPPGTYPITVTGATAANYIITHVNGTLTVIAKSNQTITFNTPPTKTYGNPDFAAGATSTNNTIPITYTSSNPAVATIIGTNIHITGAGTSTITASQAGNAGFNPAPDVARTLTVNKANLTIRARDTVKITGQPNPVFTITYTGFVLGETVANLTTPPVATTTAVDNSAPGYYPITLSGATSSNYNIIYTNGTLTVLPLTGTGLQYLNAYQNANGNITVRIYSPDSRLADIIIYNMQGMFLARKNILMHNGFAAVEIPAQTLASGYYVVAVKGDGVKLEKIIHFLR